MQRNNVFMKGAESMSHGTQVEQWVWDSASIKQNTQDRAEVGNIGRDDLSY